MKKTILVTGGAGYIGSITILELLRNTDFDIISIDNFSNSSIKTFQRIKRISGKEIINYQIDLRDLENLKEVFEKIFSSHPSFHNRIFPDRQIWILVNDLGRRGDV
jgi:UDP-glucose 4-epimerase